MDKVNEAISPQLREAVRRFGFNKVAAKMFGVEDITDKTAAEIIGTKMMTRLAEWRAVSTGLQALGELRKTAMDPHLAGALLGAAVPIAVIGANMLGKPFGHAMGRAQADRGEPHTYGASQVMGSMLPGGAGYQEGRFMAHATAKDHGDKKEKKDTRKDKE